MDGGRRGREAALQDVQREPDIRRRLSSASVCSARFISVRT